MPSPFHRRLLAGGNPAGRRTTATARLTRVGPDWRPGGSRSVRRAIIGDECSAVDGFCPGQARRSAILNYVALKESGS
jgi:hypothetical protein